MMMMKAFFSHIIVKAEKESTSESSSILETPHARENFIIIIKSRINNNVCGWD